MIQLRSVLPVKPFESDVKIEWIRARFEIIK